MSYRGNCFVVMPPHCAADTVILGRNDENESLVGVSQEIYFYDNSESMKQKDALVIGPKFRIILQTPKPGVWGGDCGSNERNVSVAITWSNECENDVKYGLTVFDIVRILLACSNDADVAVNLVGGLVVDYVHKDAKFSLIICDPSKVWLFSCASKLWAATELTTGYHHVPSDGLAVTSRVDESIDYLRIELEALGLFDNKGDVNFAACFNCSPNSSTEWSGDEPSDDGSYSLTSMFGTLRSAANELTSRSSSVFVLRKKGISCHWFTATPNASESVFKPFIFAPHPKISRITNVISDMDVTLLHKFHAQRKPASLEHLKALEADCVEEVSAYIAEHPQVNEELDELMKDCVEAEIKFYR